MIAASPGSSQGYPSLGIISMPQDFIVTSGEINELIMMYVFILAEKSLKQTGKWIYGIKFPIINLTNSHQWEEFIRLGSVN